MDQSWTVTVGKLALYLYFALLGAALTGIVFRRAFGSARPAPVPYSGERALPDVRRTVPGGTGAPETRGNRWRRFLLEYVGNIDLREYAVPGGERRRNRQARILMDHIREAMTTRELQPSEAERLMEELRESIRTDGRERTG